MLFGVTVDAHSTTDMDDGLFAEMDGPYVRLFVAVANVGARVKAGDAADGLARERVYTRYARGKTLVQPMLPGDMASACSLLPCEPRSVVVVELVIAPHGEIVRSEVRVDTFTSLGRVAYNEVPSTLDGTIAWRELLTEPMRAIHTATTRLHGARKARGAVAFVDPATGLLSTEEGVLDSIEEEDLVGYVMVQEAMIAANCALAKFAITNEIPILFRNHEARICAPPRADIIAQIEQGPLLSTPHLSTLIERVDVVLGRANYDACVRGHYGLCLAVYTHATSPIRRYADLVTQRQIVAFLESEPFPHSKEDLVTIAKGINSSTDHVDQARREYVWPQAAKRSKNRSRGRGVGGLGVSDIERVIQGLIDSQTAPMPEFADDMTSRIESRRLPHKTIAMLMPLLTTSADWAHAAHTLCEWFSAAPHDAVTIVQLCKGVGWSIATTTGSAKPTMLQTKERALCAVTLSMKDSVVQGVECVGSEPQMAWRRAVAAAVIEHLGGVVPTDWHSKKMGRQGMELVGS